MVSQINSINSIKSISFKAITGREYQTFSKKQSKIVDNLEVMLNSPVKNNSNKTFMNELEKRGIDFYVKPALQDNEVKISMIKRRNHTVVRLFNFGVVSEAEISTIPKKAIKKAQKQETLMKDIAILGGITLIAGLMSLIYLLPNKKIRPEYVEKSVDTITLVKDSLAKEIKL